MIEHMISVNNRQFPVHERTYTKKGKTCRAYRVRLIGDVDPISGVRKDMDVTAPTLKRLEFKLRQTVSPLDAHLDPLCGTLAF